MRFALEEEQRAFGRSLDALLTAADVPAAARAWAEGDPAPGRALLARVADAGLVALAVPEEYEGMGPRPVELAVALVELGRHAVPGPVVETVAAASLLAGLAAGRAGAGAADLLPGLVRGETLVSLVAPGGGPYALDADAAGTVIVVDPEAAEVRIAPGHGPVRVSTDPVRRLALPDTGGEVLARGPGAVAAGARAGQLARLLTAAQCLGTGQALLDRTVGYVRQRVQFGTPVGGFQAVKHRLADTLIGLEFARPLVFGAAVTRDVRDIAAAKAAAGKAGYAAARTALQFHGAIGYTEEFDLALWLRRARPLRDAWGTPAECRAAVLTSGADG
ncbi:acyl-CoA dehydrogenase family protein [Streptomyces qinzhouensis]|uniref:Acyl-CoA dehydrogenase n=1 Tax=Streptomyces qinzhouensis TaxID=2599401 RepID=A0A5B8JER5_9ACTN|nr:acyl-CoA dehydrogenase family protein [Streptomyces qinzhouensis]QDY76270.1 acyl-CoA dehydrogenase [Streptomyces qinzhouensis]